MGVDIAAVNDYTVIIVFDKTTNQMVYMHRFIPRGRQTYDLIEQAIVEAYEEFHPTSTRIDATGMGARYAQVLPSRGVFLTEWGEGKDKMKFGMNKEIIMDNLGSLIAGHHIHLFRTDDVVNELEKMTRTARESGVFKISAPKGEHDDIPIALALATIGVNPLVEVYSTMDMKHLKPEPSWWHTVSKTW